MYAKHTSAIYPIVAQICLQQCPECVPLLPIRRHGVGSHVVGAWEGQTGTTFCRSSTGTAGSTCVGGVV